MKILHTADWHLGKRLEHLNRLEEQKRVLQEIIEIADEESVDVVLIAGDLFDTFNPSAEAVDLFYQTLKTLSKDGKRAIVAIAGNHDSPDRIEAPDPLAKTSGILFLGYPKSEIHPFRLNEGIEVLRSAPGFVELKLPEVVFPLRLLLTPYANEYRLKQYLGTTQTDEELRVQLSRFWQEIADSYCDDRGLNILVAHLFFTKEGQTHLEEPEEEKPILHVGGAQALFPTNIPEQLDYVALGHLHRKQVIDDNPCPIVYAGSPVAYSFSEHGQRKSVTILEAEGPGQLSYRSVELKSVKPVIRHKVESVAEGEAWLKENSNAIVELKVVSDTYLSAQEKAALYSINSALFLIPEVRTLNPDGVETKGIDLNQRIEHLFEDFFKLKHGGQAPNEEIMTLFKEVLSK